MPQELTFETTSRTVQTNDWKIHFNEAGEGHPLLMLHGSGPGATGWSNFGPNLKALSTRYRVIAADMPGWGESAAVTYDERDHVEATLQLLDALEIEKAAFVGNSMGGMTALRFATEHPERMSHLITMGSGSPGPLLFGAGDGPTEGLKILRKGYQDPSPETMRQLVDVMTFDSRSASEELIRQRSDAARARPDHLANFIAGMDRGLPFMDLAKIARIQLPTLLFHGRDDRVVHYEHSLKLVSLIPHSRLVLMNRCGHWLQLEHAEEFNRLVDDFVSAR
ncbi:alpha/beta fold hydrolase [Saccharopolyspora karakumensis]|uniref:Alpha/beta fold hydrolase n=1 Tax=Saccharopolyspora karakumensis TaxID=2530386 RepID=A0A4R5BT14_9PSEU|nr:alpha/beta hydrolase [Saccharopolyspora karakumensis]TDD89169.1 alpha/beta fold hydrolase [Saccharopolyspora karakumensis]